MDKMKDWLARTRTAIVARLVDDWKHIHRFYSVQAAAFGALLVEAWPYVPKDVKDMLPAWAGQGLAALVFLAVLAGAAKRQNFGPKPPAPPENCP